MGDRSSDVSRLRWPDDDLARARANSESDHQVAAHLAWQCGADHLGNRAVYLDFLAARRCRLGAAGRATSVPGRNLAARDWADSEFVLLHIRRAIVVPRDPGNRLRD